MKKINFPNWTTPIALLITSILAFGLLIPRLGFYWDDWPPQLVRQVYGVQSFWNYYSFDRPFSAWTHVILSPILGGNPIKWHVFTLLLRWLASVEVWWILCILFPGQKKLAVWTSLIFLVYPAFINQSLSVTFSQHWITYTFFLASIGFMVESIRKPRLFLPFTFIALISQGFCHLTMEYFLGIELLRPIFLWILSIENSTLIKRRLIKSFLWYIPYMLVIFGYAIYRLFFFQLSDQDPNAPTFFFQLLHQPFQVINILKYNIPQDLIQILISSWANTIQPAFFSSLSFNKIPWIIFLIASILISYYIFKHGTPSVEDSPDHNKWVRNFLLIAILGIILGPLPAWMINRQVIDGIHSDRFALPALLGVSLLFVILIETMIRGHLRKSIVLGILISLSISMNIRVAQVYASRWNDQLQFYWQLAWRAPSIKPSTAILSAEELFPDEGMFATSSALNVLYPQPNQPERLALWMYGLRPKFEGKIPQLLNGANFQTNFRIFSFKTNPPDTLLVHFVPNTKTCLWVLRPDDIGDPYISQFLQQALPVSNINRIEKYQPVSGYPPLEIFGKEPVHEWCYYYQKAELARQSNDWQAVVSLGNEARQKGYSPDNSPSNVPHEWVPFIEGYAYTGSWQEAIKITGIAYTQDNRYSSRFCSLWKKLESDLSSTAELNQVQVLKKLLQCDQ